MLFKRLELSESVAITKKFRFVFHNGPDYTNIKLEVKQMMIDRLRKQYPPESYIWNLVVLPRLFTLTWMHFPLPCERVDESIFSHKTIQNSTSLYLSIYATGEFTYKVDYEAIIALFVKMEREEGKDYYIFDDTLKWCIAYTHDDYIILSGYI